MKNGLSDAILLGADYPAPCRRALRAGPISLQYEDGGIRGLRVGDTEIFRRIYIAVRDRNWGTIPAQISITGESIQEDHFQLHYVASAQRGEIIYRWESNITGTGDGRILFTFDGLAESDFLSNRIGFCVLHPAECAGRRCRLRDATRNWSDDHFPLAIAATNPFLDLTGIAHEAADKIWATAEFDGALFETEDQRNWADASFKTFCTPLRLPYPVEIRRGGRIQQSVRLSVNVAGKPYWPARSAAIRLEPTREAPQRLPAIGLSLPTPIPPHTAEEITRLKALRLAHVRIDLKPTDRNTARTLRTAADVAGHIGAKLEVVLHLTDTGEAQLGAIADAAADVDIVRWIVLHTDEKAARDAAWVNRARAFLRNSTATFGTGTDYFFMELNRGRPKPAGLDFICFCSTPQVHAFDSASMMETLAMHRTLVENAYAFCALPVAVTPITLRMRSNPVATGPDTRADEMTLPSSVDRRQLSVFAAAWTTGVLKYLAEAGASSATLYETIGWRGVMEQASGSPRPDLFPSIPSGVFPLYHVLADAGEFAGGEVMPLVSSDSLKVVGLQLRHGTAVALMIANLSDETQRVDIGAVRSGSTAMRRLNLANARHAMVEPTAYRTERKMFDSSELDLDAYEIVRLDLST